MKLLGSYRNGNYKVLIFDDGTKVRYNKLDCMIPDTVESLDLKITNRCNMNCRMCHEDSKIDGDHADLISKSFIDKLHPFTELAIGGGNPLEHPDLKQFLEKCKRLKLIPSMTIHQNHFIENFDFVKSLVDNKLIYGLGISFNKLTDDFLNKVKQIPNAVLHTIAGLTTLSDYKSLKDNNLKILILGYKQFRRGEKLYSIASESINEHINELKDNLNNIINENWFSVLSFDNLALNQLNVKDLMDKDKWEEFYMGDDGVDGELTSATMYVDMVKREFAKNSCSGERYPILDKIEDMYTFLKSF